MAERSAHNIYGTNSAEAVKINGGIEGASVGVTHAQAMSAERALKTGIEIQEERKKEAERQKQAQEKAEQLASKERRESAIYAAEAKDNREYREKQEAREAFRSAKLRYSKLNPFTRAINVVTGKKPDWNKIHKMVNSGEYDADQVNYATRQK